VEENIQVAELSYVECRKLPSGKCAEICCGVFCNAPIVNSEKSHLEPLCIELSRLHCCHQMNIDAGSLMDCANCQSWCCLLAIFYVSCDDESLHLCRSCWSSL